MPYNLKVIAHRGRLLFIFYIVCIVIGIEAAVLLSSAKMPWDNTSQETYTDISEYGDPVLFKSGQLGDDVYSYFTASIMSSSIAQGTQSDGTIVKFVIILDENYNPAILCMRENQMEQYQDLIYYSMGYTSDITPDPVTINGFTTSVPSSLIPYVVQAFNELSGQTAVNSSTFTQVFGTQYLDISSIYSNEEVESKTSSATSANIIKWISIIAAAVLAVLIPAIFRVRRHRINQATLHRLSPDELTELSGEIEHDVLFHTRSEYIYITQNYVLLGKQGLLAINVHDISDILILSRKEHSRLQLSTMRGEVITTGKMSRRLYDQILAAIQTANPSCPLRITK